MLILQLPDLTGRLFFCVLSTLSTLNCLSTTWFSNDMDRSLHPLKNSDPLFLWPSLNETAINSQSRAFSVHAELTSMREARTSDAIAIEALYRSLGGIDIVVRADTIESIARDPTQFLLICKTGDEICCVTHLSLHRDLIDDEQSYCIAETLSAADAYRGGAIEEQVTDYVQRLCRLCGFAKIMFVSIAASPLAQQFCAQHGFVMSPHSLMQQHELVSQRTTEEILGRLRKGLTRYPG
jgi:N-acetylglutamate synthase-like GNAT family acetyltransferase